MTQTTAKSQYDLIKELESEVQVRSIQVKRGRKTFRVYPWIKPAIFSMIGQPNRPRNSDKGIFFQLKHLLSGIRFLFSRPTTLILSTTHERRKFNATWRDKLFHHISIHPSLQPALTVEMRLPSSAVPLRRYDNPRVISRSIFFLVETIYSLVFLRRVKVEGLDLIRGFLKRYGVQANLLASVRKHLAQYAIMKLYLKCNPRLKYLFLSVSYTNFGAVRACRERGVVVVEAQHGVISKHHYGYSYAYQPEPEQFPHYLLSFGTADAEFINGSALGSVTMAVAVGSYIIDHHLAQEDPHTTGDRINTVAVSLQDCSHGIAAMESFIELAKMNPHIRFFLKRRRLSREFYEPRLNLPQNMEFEEQMDVYQLILRCDAHLTAYSTCAIEANALGRINLLFNINNKAREHYTDKLLPGAANRYCDNLHELDSALRVELPDGTHGIQQSNARNIYPGYMKNLTTFIEALISDVDATIRARSPELPDIHC